jgi:hypothetical protein
MPCLALPDWGKSTALSDCRSGSFSIAIKDLMAAKLTGAVVNPKKHAKSKMEPADFP